jgi:hypothetical protein
VKRLAIGEAIKKLGLSERHACHLVGLSRNSYRHPPQSTPENAEISVAIIDLAQARRRFGYRRIHDMLRPVFPGINHKRVYRLYSVANLAVRKRRNPGPPSVVLNQIYLYYLPKRMRLPNSLRAMDISVQCNLSFSLGVAPCDPTKEFPPK